MSLNSVINQKHTVRLALVYKGKILLLQKGYGSGEFELPGGNPKLQDENKSFDETENQIDQTDFEAAIDEFTQEVDKDLGNELKKLIYQNLSNEDFLSYFGLKEYLYNKNGQQKTGCSSLVVVNLDKIKLSENDPIVKLLNDSQERADILKINTTKKESGGWEDNHVAYKWFDPLEYILLSLQKDFNTYRGKEIVSLMNHTKVRLPEILEALGLHLNSLELEIIVEKIARNQVLETSEIKHFIGYLETVSSSESALETRVQIGKIKYWLEKRLRLSELKNEYKSNKPERKIC